jgi:hypothetical protein
MKVLYRIGIVILTLLAFATLWALPSTTVEAQASFGTNWIGQFANGRPFPGSGVLANFPNGLNQLWTGAPTDGAGAIIPGINADNWSARFDSIQTFQPGTYTFILTYDDTIVLSISNLGVLEEDFRDDNPGPVRTRQIQITFVDPGQYQVRVDFGEVDSNAVLQVSWVFNSGSGTPIPGVTAGPTPTTGPTPTPVPIATGQVEGVRGLSLRTGPYIGASFIAVVRPGTVYPILATNNSEGIFTWYLIRFSDTRQGWVSGRYFRVEGNSAALPAQGTVFDQIDNAPDVGLRGTTRSVMNMRVRPSERTRLLQQIPWGAEVVVLGRTRQGGRDFWYHVRYNNQLGWILAGFVRLSGPADFVPVR